MDKEQLYNIALTFIGTPHINGGNVKGAGLDCCTLPAQMLKEAADVDIDIEFGYSGDWFCAKECKEILLPYLEKHFYKVDELEPGDLISYRWGRAEYAHLAVYLGDDTLVHCSADVGVEITDIMNPYLYDGRGRSRVTGYWRLKQ